MSNFESEVITREEGAHQ